MKSKSMNYLKNPEKKKGFPAGQRIDRLFIANMCFVAIFVAMIIALIFASLFYIDIGTVREVLRSPQILSAMRLSAITSAITVLIIILFSVPIGYALSRYRFPGHLLADTIVDLPIVLPPLVIGVFLLVFFQTSLGKWIESHGLHFVYSVNGIVLCQFLVAASYGILVSRDAFDAVDRRLEHVALTLGCSSALAFRRVTLPLARNGIITGAILAWARAVGVFGPLMLFTGAVRMKTEVMPTTIYLELSIGRIEVALDVALVMLVMAASALAVIHWLMARSRVLSR